MFVTSVVIYYALGDEYWYDYIYGYGDSAMVISMSMVIYGVMVRSMVMI